MLCLKKISKRSPPTTMTSDSTISSTRPLSEEVTHQATKQLNAFQRFLDSIDWDKVLAWTITKVLYILLMTVLFLVMRKIFLHLVDKGYRKQIEKMEKSGLNPQRQRTIKTLVHNIVQYTLVFFYIYSILTILGVPVSSLLAGAGIAGLTISLGAQGFMNDIITGMFIIGEKQLDVGDYVKLLNINIEGTVMAVGIRTTQLRGVDGTLHYVPNRNITTISNLSRSDMLVMIDVRIELAEGYEKIYHVIDQQTQKLANEFRNEIKSGPTIFGLVDLGNSNYAIRVTMYTENSRQYALKEQFLADYVTALTANGFTIPHTPIIPMK